MYSDEDSFESASSESIDSIDELINTLPGALKRKKIDSPFTDPENKKEPYQLRSKCKIAQFSTDFSLIRVFED